MTFTRLGVDRCLAWCLGAVVVASVYVTAPSIGYARDEGFYFQAADAYGRWLTLLGEHPAEALTRKAVDAHFRINAEHPSLMKLLFALSHRLLFEQSGLVPLPGLAMRVPGMLMAGLATTLVARWGMRAISRWAGLVGAMLFITLPRVFHHAHLACFDVAIVATILATIYAYHRAMTTQRLSWALATGLFYGLALDTKHNAWTLPAVLACHLLVTEGRLLLFGSARQRWVRLRPWLAMVTIGPAVLLLLWPWLWFDTFERLRFWVEFHLRHDYYNMEFLGQTYHRPPMPRGYAWLMTLGTVPLATLVLFLVGVAGSATYAIRRRRAAPTKERNTTAEPRRRSALRASSCPEEGTTSGESLHQSPPSDWPWADERTKTDVLWLLGLLAGYAPWLSTTTPIFGGTKHWLTAYPFLCLFAARGFARYVEAMKERLFWADSRVWQWRATAVAASFVWLSPAFVITSDSVPLGLTAYTPLVGGAPGAATLGLNRGFWGYTSIAAAETLHRLLPRGGRVFVHDAALQSWDMHQQDGTIGRHLQPSMSPAQSSVALYHHEPHMARVEYQIWEAYGTTAPTTVTALDGVPMMWLYARPELAANR